MKMTPLLFPPYWVMSDHGAGDGYMLTDCIRAWTMHHVHILTKVYSQTKRLLADTFKGETNMPIISLFVWAGPSHT